MADKNLRISSHLNLDPNPDNWVWQDDAACKGKDVELFFLEPSERNAKKRAHYAAAKAVCAPCPVKAECLAHALKVPEDFGVWGGTTPEERKVIRVRIRRNGSTGITTDGNAVT